MAEVISPLKTYGRNLQSRLFQASIEDAMQCRFMHEHKNIDLLIATIPQIWDGISIVNFMNVVHKELSDRGAFVLSLPQKWQVNNFCRIMSNAIPEMCYIPVIMNYPKMLKNTRAYIRQYRIMIVATKFIGPVEGIDIKDARDVMTFAGYMQESGRLGCAELNAIVDMFPVASTIVQVEADNSHLVDICKIKGIDLSSFTSNKGAIDDIMRSIYKAETKDLFPQASNSIAQPV